MRLSHYTTTWHFAKICEDGYLKTCESNIGAPEALRGSVSDSAPLGPHAGPDVVWLTSGTYGGTSAAPLPGALPKDDLRFVVEVEDAQHWPEWASAHDIDPEWYEALAQTGNPDEWYVVEREIPVEEWVAIYSLEPVDNSVGRNAPCPCESGNKFKHCHWGQPHYEVLLVEQVERQSS